MESKEGTILLEGDEEINKETSKLQNLLEKFDDVEYVLDNAALASTLLHYRFTKSQEYFSLLFYYTVQKYHKLVETKNSMRNYNHINMEIYTVFIHPKSILAIPLENEELVREIEENIDTEECILSFTKASSWIVLEVINGYLQEFRESLQLGVEPYEFPYNLGEDMSRTEELKVLQMIFKTIQTHLVTTQKSRCLPTRKHDIQSHHLFHDFQIHATIQALNTQYEYFLHNKKYTYSIRHPESMIPEKTFLSNSIVKLTTKQRIRGHCFEDLSKSRVAFCLVCDIILWGPYPQCVYCRHCRKAIHRDCKDMFEYCQAEIRKTKRFESFNSFTSFTSFTSDISKYKSIEDVINFKATSTDSLNTSMENSMASDQNTLTRTFRSDSNYNPDCDKSQYFKYKEKSKPLRKLSVNVLQDLKWPFSNGKGRKISIKSNNFDWYSKRNSVIITRSESVGSIYTENLYSLNRNKSPTSEDDEQKTPSPMLIPIEYDPELQVSESFDPAIEFKNFSSNKSFFVDGGEYNRMLVLMEFHHKIKFIRMTLKKIQNIFVDPWRQMEEYMELFECLSLDCIEKLYKLIGSLVDVVDLCKGEKYYENTIATDVLCWLSKENDSKLRQWLQLSINLCCTNTLNPVKASWMEQKQLPVKLNDIFSREINRMRIIEQLSNMRSLLFNLPMIVTKIVKDLQRFDQFREEAEIWIKIGQKLSQLPQVIEKRCMPVVQLINNGTILSSSLKYRKCKKEKDHQRKIEIYIDNFPKTIFKNNFLDFQFVKISKLLEYSEGESKSMQSSTYIKEEVDVAAICYDDEMILLQKENEKYLLKQFKSPGSNKLFPVINFNQIHITKNTIKEKKQFQHELTILILNPAILLQINFKEEESRDMWMDHITKMSNKMQSESKIKTLSPFDKATFNDTFDLKEDHSKKDFPENISKISEKSSFNETVNTMMHNFDLISKELVMDEVKDDFSEKIQEDKFISTNEFMIRYMNICKEYAVIGTDMIAESGVIDTNVIPGKETILLRLPQIEQITQQMMILIQTQKINIDEIQSNKSFITEDHDYKDGLFNDDRVESFSEDTQSNSSLEDTFY